MVVRTVLAHLLLMLVKTVFTGIFTTVGDAGETHFNMLVIKPSVITDGLKVSFGQINSNGPDNRLLLPATDSIADVRLSIKVVHNLLMLG